MKRKLISMAVAVAFLSSTQAQAVTMENVPYKGFSIGNCTPVKWVHISWLPCFSI